jgi:hypothetical protein
VFGPALADVLATTSREVLGAGAGLSGAARTAALRAAAERTLRAVTTAVRPEAS